ncbi:hypothetical protein [Chromobacterium sphagni]|uniref:hypothetical protein n=1 Tax=Chromobacterium sphagni TaxID=1903179 RepID=UPI0019D39FDE|nr:hypothetical protein [Chromobacterium sphagni]
MDAAWQVESGELVYINPWFVVRELGVRQPDGWPISYFSVHHPRPAVGILAIEQSRLLLIGCS